MEESYKWKYTSLGGAARVNLTCGEDVAHLGELDRKLWTVLSCPAGGLQFDQKTLEYLDKDCDGKIRVDEVISASSFLTSSIKELDTIMLGNDNVSLNDFNTKSSSGSMLLATAKTVLEALGKPEKKTISLSDMAEAMPLFTKTDVPQPTPFGENTAAALAACEAIAPKMEDYFLRCSLVRFDENCESVVDTSAQKIAAVSGEMLTTSNVELLSCPIARPSKEGKLHFDSINPAWQDRFNALKVLVFNPTKKNLTEGEWNELMAKFNDYKAWNASKSISVPAELVELDKFLHYFKNLFSFLRNYVSFNDFYSTSPKDSAIFEEGSLYIDQRCCSLCIRVDNMAAHTDMAGLSGMFLIYCKCTSKTLGKTMDILSVMTDGGVKNLRVGTNAVFYDREGHDWDAVVTKIIDNPISIKQAFLDPYRKFGNALSNRINKSVAKREKEVNESMENKANSLTLPTSADQASKEATQQKSAFDIAKFAGIFAAIGMAIGYVTSAITKIIDPWYNVFLFLAAIFIIISGPSVFLAWQKLRKRNLGPVLNANGWAINSVVLVNVIFGATLTSVAKYPILQLSETTDKKKKEKKGGKVIVWIAATLAVLAVAIAVLIFLGIL